MTAAAEWAVHLRNWGIPHEILDQAPESPWIHPTESFRVDAASNVHVDTPSRLRALEALTAHGGTRVLDVGCGGGRAALGLVPPATHLVGVDHQASMLELFAEAAERVGAESTTLLGDWPDVAASTPVCDVVVCHHVFYNVQDLVTFAAALTDHARHRVVVEMPMHHPLSNLSTAWRHFWSLERPSSPTAHDAAQVLREMGLQSHVEEWHAPTPRTGPITDLDVRHTRVRLCLSADRDPEVRALLEASPPQPRHTATIWWDR